MNKETIELYRVKTNIKKIDLPSFYENNPSKQKMLDEICAWSNRMENKDKKVFEYYCFTRFENVQKDKFYYTIHFDKDKTQKQLKNLTKKFKKWKNQERYTGYLNETDKFYKNLTYIDAFPLCEIVFYLKIYYQ